MSHSPPPFPAAFAVLIALLLPWPTTPSRAAPQCSEQTAAVAAMPEITVWPGGKPRVVKLADTPTARAAGMQWLCRQAIARNPMLFVFPEPRRALFHGFNVFAPLDVAFLNGSGLVLGTRRLEPNEEISFGDDVLVTAVLEAEAGSFARWGLEAGQQLRVEKSLRDLARQAR